MFKVKLNYILLFINILTFALNGQNSIKYSFDHITIKDGLPHNTVTAILQDRYGYMWIGTNNGLNRYDGYQFKVYNSKRNNQKYGFKGKHISTIFEDSKGNLWVGTNTAGINFKSNISEKFINFKDKEPFKSISNVEITSFFEDDSNRIWITTIGNGVMVYNPVDEKYNVYNRSNSNLSNDSAFSVSQDKKGNIWVACSGAGINKLNSDNKFQLYHSEVETVMNGYRKTLLADDNYLWIATEGSGLYRMNIHNMELESYVIGDNSNNLNNNFVRDILKTSDGNILIATDGGGLNVLDINNNTIYKYKYKNDDINSLNSNALLCLSTDEEENIWIGTFNGGINLIRKNKFRFESIPLFRKNENNRIMTSVLCITELETGEVWVGTDGSGIVKIKPDKDFSYTFSGQLINIPDNYNSIIGNIVKVIYEDSQHRIWIGYYGMGMDMYDPKSSNIIHYNSTSTDRSFGAFNVWDIIEYEGELWIASLGNGLYRLDKQGLFTNFKHEPDNNNSLSSNTLIDLLITKNGKLWIATKEKGLDVLDIKTGIFTHFELSKRENDNFNNNEIRALFEDSNSGIWVGTEGGGLYLIEGDTIISHYTMENHLLSDDVMAICEDENLNIWVSFFEGISILDKKTNQIININFNNLERYNQFNQMAILKTSSNNILFGGINGLIKVDPTENIIKYPEYAITITELKILNNKVIDGKIGTRKIYNGNIETTDKIYLNHKDKTFSIYFSTFNFLNQSNTEFKYRLLGFDNKWQNIPKGQNYINYTNIEPGKYKLLIKNDKFIKELEIIMVPPFWNTILFKILSFLILILVLLFFLRMYVNRKEEIHAKEMLLSNLEILKLNNEKMEHEVKNSNAKLLSYSAQMAYKNELLNELKEKIKELDTPNLININKVVKRLDNEILSDDYWEQFNIYFDKVDNNFINVISQLHPELTNNDLRTCALIRLNLSTKEIATLLNISVRGVEKARYRLKKRLMLSPEQDLQQYIFGI